MLIPGTAAYNTWHKMNNTKNILLKIHQGYPDDSEFDDTIELIDAFLHGQEPVDEVIELQAGRAAALGIKAGSPAIPKLD